MELLLAQRELMCRCYRWSLQVAEQQAQTGYPLLRPLSNSNMLGFLATVEPLDLNQRLLLAKALVKSSYFLAPKEVNIEEWLGDQFTPEERDRAAWYSQRMGQLVRSSPRTPPLPKDCVPMKAKKLTKTVISHLSETLQVDFVREEAYNWRSTAWVNDWEVITELCFSGKGIECEHWVVHRDDPQTVPVHAHEQFSAQSRHFDFVRRLGIGPTWWVVECEQDVPAALDSIAAICRQVASQSPALFNGLGKED